MVSVVVITTFNGIALYGLSSNCHNNLWAVKLNLNGLQLSFLITLSVEIFYANLCVCECVFVCVCVLYCVFVCVSVYYSSFHLSQYFNIYCHK